MILFFKWFSHLPLWLAHPIGAVLGWVVFVASPTYRRRFLANSRLAGYTFGQVAGAVAHAGRMVAELPKLWNVGTQDNKRGAIEAPFEWESPDSAARADAAYGRGKGVIFLTPHLGCFEILAQAWAQRFSAQHGPFTVLFRPARKPWMAELVAGSRNRPGLRAVPTNLSGVRQMIKALRKGEAVGLLPDQVPPDGMGLWAPFFGKGAYTMTLAARLAAQTGATILVGWGERLPWGRGYKLHFHELNQGLGADLEAAVWHMNTEMEALIRACPTQYLWGYGRYKHPRQEPSQESAAMQDKPA